MSTLPDFVRETERVYKEYAVCGETSRFPAVWHDFFPAKTKQKFLLEDTWHFSPSSFKQGISVSHCWQARLHDIRRRKNVCYLDKDRKVTAVNFSAAMLPSIDKIPMNLSCQPIALEVKAEAEPEGEEAAAAAKAGAEFLARFDDVGSEEIGMASKEMCGWAVSYRSSEPENRLFSSWRKRWSKHRATWASYPLQPGSFRTPQAAQLKKQMAWRQNRRKKKVAVPTAS